MVKTRDARSRSAPVVMATATFTCLEHVADGSSHVGPAKIKTLIGTPHMLDHFVVIRWAYFEKAALLTETTKRSVYVSV